MLSCDSGWVSGSDGSGSPGCYGCWIGPGSATARSVATAGCGGPRRPRQTAVRCRRPGSFVVHRQHRAPHRGGKVDGLTPASVSVISDPSSPTSRSACRATYTVVRTVPTRHGVWRPIWSGGGWDPATGCESAHSRTVWGAPVPPLRAGALRFLATNAIVRALSSANRHEDATGRAARRTKRFAPVLPPGRFAR